MVDQMSNLLAARRLMISAEQYKARREGKDVKISSAKEAMEEDQLLLSGEAESADKVNHQRTPSPADETRINLADLAQKLKELSQNPQTAQQTQPPAAQNQFIAAYQRSETEVTVRYRSLERVDGLVRRSENLAETDRYQFEFTDGATFKIVDKWTGKFTSIWGDPHVDTSDQEGDRNGEFSDLKGSDLYTTMMLEDGTRLTFTARDNGLIEQVDIFKDQQHLRGIGAGSKTWSEATSFFKSQVDKLADTFAASTPMGDTVYAGGDGADWYDASGNLVWGKTTAPHVSTRPSSVMEIEIKQQFTQVTAAGFFNT